jgi:hypothetical protein
MIMFLNRNDIQCLQLCEQDRKEHECDDYYHLVVVVVVVVVAAALIISMTNTITNCVVLESMYTHKQCDPKYLLSEITLYEVYTSNIKQGFISVTAYKTNES